MGPPQAADASLLRVPLSIVVLHHCRHIRPERNLYENGIPDFFDIATSNYLGSEISIIGNTFPHDQKYLDKSLPIEERWESFLPIYNRLKNTGYTVWCTPFGYLCEWDLSVYGESLARVFKEF